MKYFADKKGHYIGQSNTGSKPDGAAVETEQPFAPGHVWNFENEAWEKPAAKKAAAKKTAAKKKPAARKSRARKTAAKKAVKVAGNE